MDTDWMGGRGRRKKDLQGEKRLEKEIEKSLNVKFLFKKKKKKNVVFHDFLFVFCSNNLLLLLLFLKPIVKRFFIFFIIICSLNLRLVRGHPGRNFENHFTLNDQFSTLSLPSIHHIIIN